MTFTAAADITLAQLRATLASSGQWLPIDGDPDESLGQLVLRNSTGPLRLGFGAWRDLLLGAQFVNGRGELISAGGRVLKNVAGYDLTKLLVGSGGVFGTPVTVTARTFALPSGAVHVELPPDPTRVAALLPTALRPAWAILRRDRLLLGYLGDADATSFFAGNALALEPRRIGHVSLEADDALRRAYWPARPLARAAVPPAALGTFLADACPDCNFSADPAFGVVLLERDDRVDLENARHVAAAVDGHLTIFDPQSLRPRQVDLDPATYTLLRRLKQAFDPDAALPPLPPNQQERP